MSLHTVWATLAVPHSTDASSDRTRMLTCASERGVLCVFYAVLCVCVCGCVSSMHTFAMDMLASRSASRMAWGEFAFTFFPLKCATSTFTAARTWIIVSSCPAT